MYVCMYVYMYACIYVSMYVCMYVCMHVSMYVCVYVRRYVLRTYVCTYVYLQLSSNFCVKIAAQIVNCVKVENTTHDPTSKAYISLTVDDRPVIFFSLDTSRLDPFVTSNSNSRVDAKSFVGAIKMLSQTSRLV